MSDRVVWVAAGGTAGHLHAGLEVATALGARARVLLVTSDRPVEDATLRGHAIERVRLAEAGIVRARRAPKLGAFGENVRRLLAAPQPSVAVGLGGAPQVLALAVAAARRARIVLVEQNAVLGRANRLMAPFASELVLAWPARVPRLVRDRAVIVGPPTRELPPRAEARSRLGIAPDAVLVVVTSGSLGSLALNTAMVEVVGRGLVDDVVVWHFLGERNVPPQVPDPMASYQPVVGFDPRLGDAIAAADVVVARAGSSTLAEIAIAGVASVLVPLPKAPGDHQRANAEYFVAAGASEVVEEGPGLAERLGRAIAELAVDPSRRTAMGAAARALVTEGATERLVEEVARWLE